MKRVIQINDIILDNSLFISTEFDIDDYIGERSLAIDGSSVMFVQAKGLMSQEVQVYSKSSGWIHETTKDVLSALDLTSEITLTFNDSTTKTYFFDTTKIPMQFESLYDGSLWYNITLNLLKG